MENIMPINSKPYITLNDLFTDLEIKEAVYLCQISTRPIEELEKFLAPIMPRINKITNQENHPKYFAYLLQHVANQFTFKTPIN